MDCCLLDLDGTVRPPPLGRPPEKPKYAKELGDILSRMRGPMRQTKLMLGAATGAPRASTKLTEGHLHFRFNAVATSYCQLMTWRGGQHQPVEAWLVKDMDQVLVMVREVTPALTKIAQRFGAAIDDQGVAFTMFVLPPGSPLFGEVVKEVEHVLAPWKHLVRFVSNAHDGGITAMTRDGGKQLLVDEVHKLNMRVLIGAGDTGSDLPLLAAAKFPIVTRTEPGAALNPKLVELVRQRGRGYLAREDEPHGVGLMQGLLAARQAKVVSF